MKRKSMWEEIEDAFGKFVEFMFGFVWVLLILGWIFMYST
jgi:hypothetical protein